jgi:TonB family protein
MPDRASLDHPSHRIPSRCLVASQGIRTGEAWKQWEGRVIEGKFRLLQYLGGSDHSAVYLTEIGEREPRKAAIKFIISDPDSAEAQLSCWQTAAKTVHPHLTRLFEAGRANVDKAGVLYVVMEYAPEDLSQILPERALTPAEAQEMLAPLLDVLAELHGKGLVHGHAKPANIMAVEDQLKIASDGLSKVGESRIGPEKMTAYDAPETRSGELTPAADVWSLGMTLVECLTQRLPARDSTDQNEPVVPETMPPPFFAIARNCLRLDPQRRWTVAEIKAHLQPDSSVPAAKPASRAPSAPAPTRYTISIAVALALLMVLVALRLISHHPQLPSSAVPQPQTRAPAAKMPAPETNPPVAQRPSPPKAKPPTGPVEGGVKKQVLPDVPRSARDTIQGTVRVAVKVTVDASGNVTEARLDSPASSKYFAKLALQAARDWKFQAPEVEGENVSSEWILRFRFARSGTDVVPVRALP